ncbi:MAG: coenzyme F420-0:L-glutamate ligase [Gammaproteobacteria bacterium]
MHVVPNIPMVRSGDHLGDIITTAIDDARLDLEEGDVIVIAQKIVSKAEGRLITLTDIEPSAEARALAAETEKDPALCQLIIDESAEILRKKPGVIIVRHKLGHVGANAGIDQSNIEHDEGDAALLLPQRPDESARALHEFLSNHFDCHIGVIIADSMNRPWRMGTLGAAIGCAGVQVLDDLRGGEDMYGRELKVSMVNIADSITAAACLLMGETTEGRPVVLVKGLAKVDDGSSAADIMRPVEDDLFR